MQYAHAIHMCLNIYILTYVMYILCVRFFFFVGFHNLWLFNDVFRQMLQNSSSLLYSGNEISGAYVKHS